MESRKITQENMVDFLSQEADFSFEMRVAKKMTDLGCKVNHSGYYEDPVTNKTREFDIRAEYQSASNCLAHLAVECKNLRDSFPLLVHCSDRKLAQAHHFVLRNPSEDEYVSNQEGLINHTDFVFQRTLEVKDLYNTIGITPYGVGGVVGKAMDQVGVDSKGRLKSNDGQVFEKMFQAIQSSSDLVHSAFERRLQSKIIYQVVVPLLVVPDEMLWTVLYDSNGVIKKGPEQVSCVQYYVGKKWSMESAPVEYTMTHLDIVTFSHLTSYIESHFKETDAGSFFYKYIIKEFEEAINA